MVAEVLMFDTRSVERRLLQCMTTATPTMPPTKAKAPTPTMTGSKLKPSSSEGRCCTTGCVSTDMMSRGAPAIYTLENMDSIDVGDMLGAMDDWIESAWPWELATISIWIRTDAEVTVMITSDGWTRSVFATLARIRLVTGGE